MSTAKEGGGTPLAREGYQGESFERSDCVGYSKLSYDDMVEHPEIWRIEKELVSPAWAEEISELGYKGVWAVDFYNDVFGEHLEPSRMPEDYQTGEYGAIALEIFDEFTKDKKGRDLAYAKYEDTCL